MATTSHPFAVDEPGNIPLPSAPLVRTIAQVRFPPLTQFAVNGDAVASAIAAALADEYPVMQVGKELSVAISFEGVKESQSDMRLWRLTSGDRSWKISFSGTFLSIDTTAYDNRSDFARRLADAWKALNDQVAVPYVERLGVRYINQVAGRDHMARLPELLRPEVLGISMADGQDGVELTQALSEARYRFSDGGAFQARWGLLPENVVIDEALQPLDYQTWMLDLDSFHEWAPGVQSGSELFEDVRGLALRAYQFFRWAVTEEFLLAFGGKG